MMSHKRNIAVFTVAASYLFWGVIPLFWSLFSGIGSMYTLAQRIVWSVILLALFILLTGRGTALRAALSSLHVVLTCILSSILITMNWGLYIYAVTSKRVLDSSLGFYMVPVVVGLMSVLLLKEPLSVWEWLTLLISGAGLAYAVVCMGFFPLLSLLIAATFAGYGAVKKNLSLDSFLSLFIETVLVLPFALGYILIQERTGQGFMESFTGIRFFLLPLSGLATILPLLLFNLGVGGIPYYITGILTYINPTMQFLLGIFYFHEAPDRNRMVLTLIILTGVLFTVYDQLRRIRQNRRSASATGGKSIGEI